MRAYSIDMYQAFVLNNLASDVLPGVPLSSSKSPVSHESKNKTITCTGSSSLKV